MAKKKKVTVVYPTVTIEGRVFTEIEESKILEFQKRHGQCYHKDRTDFRIKITGTGIGPNVRIKCKGCDVVEDVTDFESW